MRIADVLDLLRASRFDLSSEKAIQADIERVLTQALPRNAWEREFRLNTRDRPDFVIWSDDGTCMAVEVKGFRQRGPAVTKQLQRYAEDGRVASLSLLSNTAINLPARIGDKPLTVISLGRAWL